MSFFGIACLFFVAVLVGFVFCHVLNHHFGSINQTSIGNIYYKQMSVEWAIFFAFIIEFVTLGLVYLYELLLNKYEKFRKYYLYVLGGIVAYLILIGNIWMW